MLQDAIQRNIPLITVGSTNVFEVDVTRPQLEEDSSPLIVGIVASMDWLELLTIE